MLIRKALIFRAKPSKLLSALWSALKPSSTPSLKRGLGGLATIGSTAPFVGLFGTVMGILNAFKGISQEKATGLAAVAGGIAEALVTTAFGLLVAIPAVMMFNYLTGRVEAFDVEMDNSSSELIDYFLKRRECAVRNGKQDWCDLELLARRRKFSASRQPPARDRRADQLWQAFAHRREE